MSSCLLDKLEQLKNWIHNTRAKIIRNSDKLYRGYALFSHYRLNRKRSKTNEVTDVKLCSDLKEMCNVAKSRGAIIYGQEELNEFDTKTDRPILMISHELSMTGAPIVLIHFAAALKDLGYPVIIISAGDGKQLADYCCKRKIPIIVDPLVYNTDFIMRIRTLFRKIVVNTIYGAPVINMLSGTDTDVMWWIHEASDCYGRRNAKEMPFTISDNIQIYTAGEYALKQLVRRYPHYRAKPFVYGIPELKKEATINPQVHLRSEKKKGYAFIGQWILRKGIDILAEAIDRLPKTVREGSAFIFVGKSSDDEITRKLERIKKKYPGNVLVPGEIDYQSINSIYSQTDFLIVPSRDDPLPLVIAEAMSLGCPCICSENTGSANYIIQYHAGLVYGNNSPAKLAEKIEETYYMEHKTYQIMSHNSRKLYEQVFSEEALRNRIIEDHITVNFS